MSFKQYNYNAHAEYLFAGTYTWTKPSNIDTTKPILVHVWGAGGAGNSQYVNSATGINGTGGGGGGLAVSYINPDDIAATVTVTCGVAGSSSIAVGGTSSFGTHCSAFGGNGGGKKSNNSTCVPAWDSAVSYVRGDYVEHSSVVYFCMLDNSNTEPPDGTYWSVNVAGFGGIGVGGDINRRGGQGGLGYYVSASNSGGGGGGSAPAPYGVSNGFNGGRGYTYSGGGGAGIGAHGSGNAGTPNYLTNEPNSMYGAGNGYTGASGGGSMYFGSIKSSAQHQNENGGNGLGGTGGSGQPRQHAYVTVGGARAKSPEAATGDFIINDNEIMFSGGGGTGGYAKTGTSGYIAGAASSGAPGGGGGGDGQSNVTNNLTMGGGCGGFLGGGGGSQSICKGRGGAGGNAGGGGGSYRVVSNAIPLADQPVPGQRQSPITNTEVQGGDGVIIIQYATTEVE